MSFTLGKRHKYITIWKWKSRGIICDYDAIYDIVISTFMCDYCGITFPESKDRCLDHDHDDGSVRGVVCRYCNHLMENKLNEKYISKEWCERDQKYRYRIDIWIKGKSIYRTQRNTLEEAIMIRDMML
tara:strand:+ start:87 stop:470 length:384 start_codon:yes stop_codon:yes gene_type:complete